MDPVMYNYRKGYNDSIIFIMIWTYLSIRLERKQLFLCVISPSVSLYGINIFIKNLIFMKESANILSNFESIWIERNISSVIV
jgi:hypothetical protein